MQTYQPNQQLTLTFAVVDPAGNAVQVTGGTFRVLDADGTELLAPTAFQGDLSGGVSDVTAVVPQTANALASGSAGRQVEMTFSASFGTHVQLEIYRLAGADPLVIGTNSFCTYAQAELVAAEMSSMDAYKGAALVDKTAALMDARDALCKLYYRIQRYGQDYLVDDHPVVSWGTEDMSLYSAQDIAGLPIDFQKVLRKAQVLQANYLLGANEAEHLRNDGLMSQTVGESSAMFRPGVGPLKLPVCARALDILAGYLHNVNRIRIARA